MDKHRFKISINSTVTVVDPIYGNGTGIAGEKQDGKVYFREKLTSSLVLVRDEFDLIDSQSFDTEFTLIIEVLENSAYTQIFEGVFYKTDCEFDEDNKSVSIKVETQDQYKTILDAANKEFNLIEIAPEITPIQYKKLPLIQIYIAGSDILTNIVNGNAFDVKVNDSTSDSQQLSDYGFFSGSPIIYVFGNGEISPDVSGAFSYSGFGFTYTNGNYTLTKSSNTWSISENGSLLYTGTTNEDNINATVFTSLSTGDTTNAQEIKTFGRILTDATTFNSLSTTLIPDDDIIGATAYKRMLGLNPTGFIYIYETNQIEPNKFGQFPQNAVFFAGKYYSQVSLSDSPIGKSRWNNVSIWIKYGALALTINNDDSTDETLRYAYKLSDTISALLGEIAPDITHDSTNDYSNFLYGTNAIRGTFRTPIITPKSNISIGEFEQPASIAKIRFDDIINLLESVYNARFYIEDNKFKIEHINFFENGGSYDSQVVSIDITADIEPKTGKNWGFNQNKYNFKKEALPERFEFAYMDSISQYFEGRPLNVLSNFVQKGNVKKIGVNKFNGDLDFVIANGNEVSKEGFVIVECIEDNGIFKVPFLSVLIENFQTVNLQNGYLSFYYLVPTFFKHNASAGSLEINGSAVTAITKKRSKLQKLDYIGTEKPVIGLITTGLGTGEIQDYNYNFNSRLYSGTAILDTE